MKRTVFISHSSADKEIATKICAYLEQNGVLCWIAPRDVMPGKNYGAAIVDAIDECRVFVVILSSRSNKSRQVVREVERAASSDSVILPFRIEDVLPSRELAFYVSAAHWLDAAKHPVEEQFDELLTAIQDWEKAGTSNEPPATTGSQITTSATPASVALPPPLPVAVTAPLAGPIAAPVTPIRKKSFPVWWFLGGIAAIGLLVGGWFVVQRLIPTKPITKSAESPPAPAALTSPPVSGTAEARVTSPEPVATDTPVPNITPNAPQIASSAAPTRLRPGERLRTRASADYAAAGSAKSSPPPDMAAPPPESPKTPIVREVAASSQLGDEYRPNLAFDGNPSTGWVVKGKAIQQTLFAHFKAPAVVESVSILNGDGQDEHHYHESNRIRTLRVVLSDGTNQILTFKDEMKMQRFPLTKPVTANWVKFEILSVFPGSTKKTGISEIAFNEPE